MTIFIIRKRKLTVAPVKPVAPAKPKIGRDNLDGTAQFLIEKWPNLLVPWYLMASWLYYLRDISLVSDAMYDDICKNLQEHWDDIEHVHKTVIDRTALSAGTGLYVTTSLCPLMARAAAKHLVSTEWGISVSIHD